MVPFVFKTFVSSIFEWPLKTGFTVKPKSACLKWPLKRRPKIGFQDLYHLCFKTFVLSIFEWPLKTGFTVHC